MLFSEPGVHQYVAHKMAKPGAKIAGVAHSRADQSLGVVACGTQVVLWNLLRC
jgi:hypothetical protein